MSKQLSQKEYLKKYLSKSDGTKTKKKKKRNKGIGDGLKIVDDDAIVAPDSKYKDQVELDLLLADEDAPQVAEFIDDTKMNALARTTANWQTVSDSNSTSDDRWGKKSYDKSPVDKDIIPVDSEVKNNRKYGHNEDLSPERIRNNHDRRDSNYKHKSTENKSTNNKTHIESSDDMSPPRMRNNYDRNDSNYKNKSINHKTHIDSSDDMSPPRRISKKDSHKSDLSSSKYDKKSKSKTNDKDFSESKKYHESSDDMSPPRKSHKTSKNSTSHVSNSHHYDNDLSPPRRADLKKLGRNSPKRSSYEDLSYVSHKKKSDSKRESSKHRYDYEESSKRSRHDYDENATNTLNKYSSNKRKGYDSDQDLSPPRKSKSNYDNNLNDKSRDRSHDYQGNKDDSKELSYKEKYGKTSKNTNTYKNENFTSPAHQKDKYKSNRFSSDPSSSTKARYDNTSAEKMTKTLDGKVAGLQDAKSLRAETENLRKKEKDLLLKMNDEVSGRYAKTVSRKTGKKEDSEDEEVKKARIERERVHKEKYSRWGKGLKQVGDMQAQMENDIHEMNKPLARYANDEDFDKHLRERIHADDPMLEYVKKKQMEKKVKEGIKVRPEYKGSFPSNRFDIKPGYRWDGVDRSNGYEKLWFEKMSSRKANEEEAYKWSTEDM